MRIAILELENPLDWINQVIEDWQMWNSVLAKYDFPSNNKAAMIDRGTQIWAGLRRKIGGK